ncbi:MULTISPECIES: hypothetical protein [unclassified Amycolatopsis]|uniref:hypothetical protein n=1 Tax=unclassified Amycolatopsis TaxID=2618356 RepID=UPI002E108337|nr:MULTISPECIES: hypothetical protein [unclassified Amycolatopsis]WSJ75646.1 hypothetical protein OG439_40535 [Amycolatopsis sp. NBC_01307]WSK80720.1 hypothetical protein OG570_09210 [Amycolatopsis sp. NBC_01286]
MTNVDPEDDVRVILTGATGDTPPMRLEAADVIERGGRIRQRRKRLAVVGTSTATAVILAVAGFLAGHRLGPPDPVQPADPGLSTIGTTAPPSPRPIPSQEEVPATSIAPPEAQPGRSVPSTQRPSSPPVAATTRKSKQPSSVSLPPPSANPTETAPEAPRTTSR